MWPFGPRTAKESSGRLGRRGEKLAHRYLRKQGLRILAANYRCPAGEVDLIGLQRPQAGDGAAATLVFVEVKSRSDDYHTDPESAIDLHKRRQMLRVARYYVASRGQDDLAVRFDSIAVIFRPDGPEQIRHTADAFGPGDI